VPRPAVEGNSRLPLRIRAARDIINEAECVRLSERDSPRVLEMLENPPTPNARLLAAAEALPPRP
jgi:uncharacterized protein (DUF1778 family)